MIGALSSELSIFGVVAPVGTLPIAANVFCSVKQDRLDPDWKIHPTAVMDLAAGEGELDDCGMHPLRADLRPRLVVGGSWDVKKLQLADCLDFLHEYSTTGDPLDCATGSTASKGGRGIGGLLPRRRSRKN